MCGEELKVEFRDLGEKAKPQKDTPEPAQHQEIHKRGAKQNQPKARHCYRPTRLCSNGVPGGDMNCGSSKCSEGDCVRENENHDLGKDRIAETQTVSHSGIEFA